MVRVSQLGQLGGNLASDILSIVSGVTGVAATAVGGQAAAGGTLTPEQQQALAAQQAAAAAKAKADADAKMWMYIGLAVAAAGVVGAGVYFSRK